MVGLPVPRVEIGTVIGCEGKQFAISHVHNERVRPLVPKAESFFQREYLPEERMGLRAASGLLPFLAWVAATDHNDNSNLVVEARDGERCRIVAVDFADAFMWGDGEHAIVLPSLPGLVTYVDHGLVGAALADIEGLSRRDICTACAAAGYPPNTRERNARVLTERQLLLRGPLEQRGWLGGLMVGGQ